MTSLPPLFGLVLAGGESRRMGRDKATLVYHGRTQLEWAFALLAKVCDSVYVSVRPDQLDEPTRATLPKIVDAQPGIGPIAGISAALGAHRDAAWIVLACDLPFLSEYALTHLIARRDASCLATAYRSTHDNLPEPLCAIWEPAAHPVVDRWIAEGQRCPRKLLMRSTVQLIDQPDDKALDNVNTPEEFTSAQAALS